MFTKKLGNALFVCFTVLTLLLVSFIGFLTVTGTKTYAVQTDSMSPLFKKGDAVFVRSIDTDTLQIGNVVTVEFKDGSGYFTHRINRIEPQNSLIYTKGDNNKSEDPQPSDYSQIIGRMWFSLPAVGALSLAMGNKILLIAMAIVAILIVLARRIVSAKIKNKEGDGKDAS